MKYKQQQIIFYSIIFISCSLLSMEKEEARLSINDLERFSYLLEQVNQGKALKQSEFDEFSEISKKMREVIEERKEMLKKVSTQENK